MLESTPSHTSKRGLLPEFARHKPCLNSLSPCTPSCHCHQSVCSFSSRGDFFSSWRLSRRPKTLLDKFVPSFTAATARHAPIIGERANFCSCGYWVLIALCKCQELHRRRTGRKSAEHHFLSLSFMELDKANHRSRAATKNAEFVEWLLRGDGRGRRTWPLRLRSTNNKSHSRGSRLLLRRIRNAVSSFLNSRLDTDPSQLQARPHPAAPHWCCPISIYLCYSYSDGVQRHDVVV